MHCRHCQNPISLQRNEREDQSTCSCTGGSAKRLLTYDVSPLRCAGPAVTNEPGFAPWDRPPVPPQIPVPSLKFEIPPQAEDEAELQPEAALPRRWMMPVRWIACGLPLVLALCFGFTALPAGQQFLPSGTGVIPDLKRQLADRSSVHWEEDFRSGLRDWKGAGNWANTWSYDSTKVMRPGKLALYTPSLSMADYTLDLDAALEQQPLGWAVRASDLHNYIGMSLHALAPGAGGGHRLERWTVRNGAVLGRESHQIRVPLGSGAKLHIRVVTAGGTVTTFIEGKIVDVFTDSPQLLGGVGLFGAPGGHSRPRIYRLEVTRHDDFLGRLCSFFSERPMDNPGNIRQ